MSRGHAHPASLPRGILETLLQRARRRDVLRLLGVASLFPLLGCREAGALGTDGGTDSSSGSDGGAPGGSCTSIPRRPPDPTRRRLQRPERARALRHRPERHPGEPRRLERGRRRGPAGTITLTLVNPVGRRARRWSGRGLPVALRCARPVLPVLLRGHRRELAPGTRPPTRRAGAPRRHLPGGCYSGRWPHMHFEVYPSLATTTASTNKRATSQRRSPPGGRRRGLRDQRLHRERGESRAESLARDNLVFGMDDAGDADGHRERQRRVRGGAHRRRLPSTKVGPHLFWSAPTGTHSLRRHSAATTIHPHRRAAPGRARPNPPTHRTTRLLERARRLLGQVRRHCLHLRRSRRARLSGSCRTGPQGEPAACMPAHPLPPPEAFEACSGLSDGANCTIRHGDLTLTSHTRRARLGGTNNVACAPGGGSPPPPRG